MIDLGLQVVREVAGAITQSSKEEALEIKVNATRRIELLVQQYYAKCVLY